MGAARQAGMKRLGFVTMPGQAARGAAEPGGEGAVTAPAAGKTVPARAAGG